MTRILTLFAFAFVGQLPTQVIGSTALHASPTAENPAQGGEQEQEEGERKEGGITDAEKERIDAESLANKEFLGIKFGLGLGLSHVSGDDLVDEAEVVNGVARVTKKNNTRPRILLESHYFFRIRSNPRTVTLGTATATVEAADIGVGPFVSVQGGSEEVLEAIGFGGMVGFRRSDSTSLNLGVGFLVDPNVKHLGDDIRDGQPLPNGETEVRFTEKSRWGLLLLASFSF